MSDAAIEVQGLGKRYRIGGNRKTYRTLRESLVDSFRRRTAAESDQDFWALREVEFAVDPGEVVGIIGRNGAGKSTLLKVLSRITDPTQGTIVINGRVGSLLEVGTGFHPELTGRENIYLNGAILGMRRREIAKKFDEIVAFAETEKFLDTPVKYYSSGMYTRLAFAVAAHLEPEILIVDEVLAVGDAEFQKKCLGKMGEVARTGRTVLFVSHNMAAVARLCRQCILLSSGQVKAIGRTNEVIAQHMTSAAGKASRSWVEESRLPGNGTVQLREVAVEDAAGEVHETFTTREGIRIAVEYEVLEAGSILSPHLQLTNGDGTVVFAAIDTDPNWRKRPRPPGRYRTRATIPPNLLAEGNFSVSVAISRFDPLTIYVHEIDAVSFDVVDRIDGSGARGDYAGEMPGVVRPLLDWATEYSGV